MKKYAVVKDTISDGTFGIIVRDDVSDTCYGISEKGVAWAEAYNDLETKSLEDQLPYGAKIGEFRGMADFEEILIKEIADGGSARLIDRSTFLHLESKHLKANSQIHSLSDFPLKKFQSRSSFKTAVEYKAKSFLAESGRGSVLAKSRADHLGIDKNRMEFKSRDGNEFLKEDLSEIAGSDGILRRAVKDLFRAKSEILDSHEGYDLSLSGLEQKRLGGRLGPKLGGGLRAAPRGMAFVDITGRVDGDNDGIVFEGIPGMERPIIPRFLVPKNMARQVSSLVDGDSMEIERQRRSGKPSADMSRQRMEELLGDNARFLRPVPRSVGIPDPRTPPRRRQEPNFPSPPPRPGTFRRPGPAADTDGGRRPPRRQPDRRPEPPTRREIEAAEQERRQRLTREGRRWQDEPKPTPDEMAQEALRRRERTRNEEIQERVRQSDQRELARRRAGERPSPGEGDPPLRPIDSREPEALESPPRRQPDRRPEPPRRGERGLRSRRRDDDAPDPIGTSQRFEGADYYDSVEGDNVEADVIALSDIYGDDTEGYGVVGRYRTDEGAESFYGGNDAEEFETVEDAMAFLERVERLGDDDIFYGTSEFDSRSEGMRSRRTRRAPGRREPENYTDLENQEIDSNYYRFDQGGEYSNSPKGRESDFESDKEEFQDDTFETNPDGWDWNSPETLEAFRDWREDRDIRRGEEFDRRMADQETDPVGEYNRRLAEQTDRFGLRSRRRSQDEDEPIGTSDLFEGADYYDNLYGNNVEADVIALRDIYGDDSIEGYGIVGRFRNEDNENEYFEGGDAEEFETIEEAMAFLEKIETLGDEDIYPYTEEFESASTPPGGFYSGMRSRRDNDSNRILSEQESEDLAFETETALYTLRRKLRDQLGGEFGDETLRLIDRVYMPYDRDGNLNESFAENDVDKLARTVDRLIDAGMDEQIPELATVKRGLNNWRDQILFPALPTADDFIDPDDGREDRGFFSRRSQSAQRRAWPDAIHDTSPLGTRDYNSHKNRYATDGFRSTRVPKGSDYDDNDVVIQQTLDETDFMLDELSLIADAAVGANEPDIENAIGEITAALDNSVLGNDVFVANRESVENAIDAIDQFMSMSDDPNVMLGRIQEVLEDALDASDNGQIIRTNGFDEVGLEGLSFAKVPTGRGPIGRRSGSVQEAFRRARGRDRKPRGMRSRRENEEQDLQDLLNDLSDVEDDIEAALATLGVDENMLWSMKRGNYGDEWLDKFSDRAGAVELWQSLSESRAEASRLHSLIREKRGLRNETLRDRDRKFAARWAEENGADPQAARHITDALNEFDGMEDEDVLPNGDIVADLGIVDVYTDYDRGYSRTGGSMSREAFFQGRFSEGPLKDWTISISHEDGRIFDSYWAPGEYTPGTRQAIFTSPDGDRYFVGGSTEDWFDFQSFSKGRKTSNRLANEIDDFESGLRSERQFDERLDGALETASQAIRLSNIKDYSGPRFMNGTDAIGEMLWNRNELMNGNFPDLDEKERNKVLGYLDSGIAAVGEMREGMLSRRKPEAPITDTSNLRAQAVYGSRPGKLTSNYGELKGLRAQGPMKDVMKTFKANGFLFFQPKDKTDIYIVPPDRLWDHGGDGFKPYLIHSNRSGHQHSRVKAWVNQYLGSGAYRDLQQNAKNNGKGKVGNVASVEDRFNRPKDGMRSARNPGRPVGETRASRFRTAQEEVAAQRALGGGGMRSRRGISGVTKRKDSDGSAWAQLNDDQRAVIKEMAVQREKKLLMLLYKEGTRKIKKEMEEDGLWTPGMTEKEREAVAIPNTDSWLERIPAVLNEKLRDGELTEEQFTKGIKRYEDLRTLRRMRKNDEKGKTNAYAFLEHLHKPSKDDLIRKGRAKDKSIPTQAKLGLNTDSSFYLEDGSTGIGDIVKDVLRRRNLEGKKRTAFADRILEPDPERARRRAARRARRRGGEAEDFTVGGGDVSRIEKARRTAGRIRRRVSARVFGRDLIKRVNNQLEENRTEKKKVDNVDGQVKLDSQSKKAFQKIHKIVINDPTAFDEEDITTQSLDGEQRAASRDGRVKGKGAVWNALGYNGEPIRVSLEEFIDLLNAQELSGKETRYVSRGFGKEEIAKGSAQRWIDDPLRPVSLDGEGQEAWGEGEYWAQPGFAQQFDFWVVDHENNAIGMLVPDARVAQSDDIEEEREALSLIGEAVKSALGDMANPDDLLKNPADEAARQIRFKISKKNISQDRQVTKLVNDLLDLAESGDNDAIEALKGILDVAGGRTWRGVTYEQALRNRPAESNHIAAILGYDAIDWHNGPINRNVGSGPLLVLNRGAVVVADKAVDRKTIEDFRKNVSDVIDGKSTSIPGGNRGAPKAPKAPKADRKPFKLPKLSNPFARNNSEFEKKSKETKARPKDFGKTIPPVKEPKLQNAYSDVTGTGDYLAPIDLVRDASNNKPFDIFWIDPTERRDIGTQTNLPVTADDIDNWERVAGPKGSQESFWIQNPKTGIKYLVKPGKTDRHAANETAVDALYGAYGVGAKVGVIRGSDGRAYTVLEEIPFGDKAKQTPDFPTPFSEEVAAQVKEHMFLDLLLSNWDVGQNDNIKLSEDGRMTRVDGGGGGFSRAQGEPKDRNQWSMGMYDWGDFITMLESRGGKRIYGTVTNGEFAAAMAQIADMDLDYIQQVLANAGVDDLSIAGFINVLHIRIAEAKTFVSRLQGADPSLPLKLVPKADRNDGGVGKYPHNWFAPGM